MSGRSQTRSSGDIGACFCEGFPETPYSGAGGTFCQADRRK